MKLQNPEIKHQRYFNQISEMGTFELLQEVAHFQELDVSELSMLQLLRGIILFDYVEKVALTPELKQASQFQRKLCERVLDFHFGFSH